MVDILVHNETQFIHCNSPSHCAKILGDKVLNGKASASPTTENILHPAVHTTELIINFINDSFIHSHLLKVWSGLNVTLSDFDL